MEIGVLMAGFIPRVAAEVPWLRVSLVPEFNNTNSAVVALAITLQLDDPTTIKADQPLLKLDRNHSETPTLLYYDDALSATGNYGALPLSYTDSNETNIQRIWTA